jgi:hypothetical protein
MIVPIAHTRAIHLESHLRDSNHPRIAGSMTNERRGGKNDSTVVVMLLVRVIDYNGETTVS